MVGRMTSLRPEALVKYFVYRCVTTEVASEIILIERLKCDRICFFSKLTVHTKVHTAYSYWEIFFLHLLLASTTSKVESVSEEDFKRALSFGIFGPPSTSDCFLKWPAGHRECELCGGRVRVPST